MSSYVYHAEQAAGSASLVAANDVIQIPVLGCDFGTVRWEVLTAGNGAITQEYTDDPLGLLSVNWKTPPFSRRLDQATANPTMQAWANTTPVAGTYETPLPGNCTAFRIRYQTAGTVTAMTLKAGRPFVADAPVHAVLYDTTSGTNSSLDTGTIDASGWNAASIDWVTSGATATAIHLWAVDSTGANVGTRLSQSVTTPWIAHLGEGGAGASFSSGGITQIAVGNLPDRIHADAGAAAAQTTRIRIVARRG